MGWSCSAAASDVMERWTAACRAQGGNQNTWEDNGVEYFWELSRTEHPDGAITGSIMRMQPLSSDPADCRRFCKRVSSFRINGDGSIASAPKFLKTAGLLRPSSPPRARAF